MLRVANFGGISAEHTFDEASTDVAQWNLDGVFPHYISGDTKIRFNRSFVPNQQRPITPIAYYEAKPDYNLSASVSNMKPLGPKWANDFEITWDFAISKGEKKVKRMGGIIQCSVCMYMLPVAAAFDIKKPWTLSFDSQDLYLWGVASLRYLMPSGPRVAVLRLMIYQSYEIVKVLPRYKFSITLTGRVLRTDITDGRMQHGDKIRTDLSLNLEEEMGEISVEGFDSDLSSIFAVDDTISVSSSASEEIDWELLPFNEN